MRKKRVILIGLLCAAMFMTSCSGTGEAHGKNVKITVTDQLGNEVKMDKEIGRIASGYYISTSALIALGVKDKIVGIEDKSELRPIYSLAAEGLTESCANVGSAKQFDLESCISCEPDLVILPKKAADYAPALKEVGISVLIVDPENEQKLADMITLLAEVTGTEERAGMYFEKKEEILGRIRSLTEGMDESEKPVVYMCSPSSYLTTCPKDMYQASLIRMAGGKNAGDVLEGDSRVEISYEQLIAMNPDIIIVPTNDFANAGPDYSAQDILSDPILKDITAVKEKAVYEMPYGLEAWDSPVPSGCLGAAWLLGTFHPELLDKAEVRKMADDFYFKIYGFHVEKAAVTIEG